MIRGNDNICTWFQGTGHPFWMVYHKASGVESGQYAFKSTAMENATNNTALDDLKKWMAICVDGSEYILVASPTEKLTSKGYSRETVEINKQYGLPVTSPAAVGGISTESVADMVKKGIEDYKRGQEVKDLREKNSALEKEVKELQKQANDPWNKFIGAISPHTDTIVKNIFPVQGKIAGFPKSSPVVDDNNNEPELVEETLTDEQQEIVSDFLVALSSHDSDWENTLKKMTAKITDNPAVISMLKSFL